MGVEAAQFGYSTDVLCKQQLHTELSLCYQL